MSQEIERGRNQGERRKSGWQDTACGCSSSQSGLGNRTKDTTSSIHMVTVSEDEWKGCSGQFLTLKGGKSIIPLPFLARLP